MRLFLSQLDAYVSMEFATEADKAEFLAADAIAFEGRRYIRESVLVNPHNRLHISVLLQESP